MRMYARTYVFVTLRNVAVSRLPRGSGTAPGRANGLEKNGAGPSGGGGGERGIFKHRGQGHEITLSISH